MSKRAERHLLALLKRHGVKRPLSARGMVVIGRWFVFKFRRNATQRGHYRTASNMRKLGVPLIFVRLILFGKL